MNYKVLYRKYRPDSFDKIIGQEYIVTMLQNAISNNKIAHAYIFSGPRGTGKTSMARIFAKAVNCTNFSDGLACNTCENCKNFSTSPDIIEIDAASNNGVEEIRELINNVKIMPTSLKYKVYIIDEVHMLSTSAFNALLLTLEEPPEHVIFILATTNIENVPITIISRCQKFNFKNISSEKITKRLIEICKKEKIKYDEEALIEISTLADGGMRDALSLLDQLSKNNEKITLKLVSDEIGTLSNEKINKIIDSLEKNDIESIIDIFNNLKVLNINYKVIIKKLINQITNYAIENLKNNNEKKLPFSVCKNIIFELNEILNKINVCVNPYDLIEMVLLNYVSNINHDKKIIEKMINNDIEKLNCSNLKNKDSHDTKDDLNTKKCSFDLSIRINNCFVDANKQCLTDFKRTWQEFIKNIDDIKLKGLIIDTIPVVSSNKYAIIITSIDNLYIELNNNSKYISERLNDIMSIKKIIVFVNKNRWEKEKKEYINKIKKGYKYEYMQEKELEVKKEKQNLDDSLNKLATSIFDINKIEIE